MFSEHPRLPDGFDVELRDIRSQLSAGQRRDLEERANVVGTGLGPRRINHELKEDSEPTLIVFVETKLPPEDLSNGDLIPPELELEGRTVQTDVQETGGEFKPTQATDPGQASPTRSRRVRPLLGGITAGPTDRTTWGTISAGLIDEDGDTVVLTARHIIAAGSGQPQGRRLVQPSNTHANDPDTVGIPKSWSDWFVDSTARMETDIATIALDDGIEADGIYLGYDRATDTGRTRADRTSIMFSGASGITSGELLASDVRANITYSDGAVVRYKGLESINIPSRAGSSGSVIGYIDPTSRALTLTGVTFAGTETRTLVMPWRAIEDEVGELTPISESTEKPAWEI